MSTFIHDIYNVQKKDVSKAVSILVDAFQHDPVDAGCRRDRDRSLTAVRTEPLPIGRQIEDLDIVVSQPPDLIGGVTRDSQDRLQVIQCPRPFSLPGLRHSVVHACG